MTSENCYDSSVENGAGREGRGGGGGGLPATCGVAPSTCRQHASISQGRVFSDNCACCLDEIEVADQNLLSHQVTAY